MAIKKYLSLERLTEYDELIKAEIAEGDSGVKSYVDTEVAKKANTSHTHSISNVTNLQSSLDAKVPTSRTINGKALSSNITLSASDIGADASGSASAVQTNLDTHTSNSDIHVTTTNKSNWNSAYTHSTSAHAPSNAEKNIIIGIQKNGTDLTVDSSTRKVNITVPTTASDIGAAASSHNHSASNITSGTLNIARIPTITVAKGGTGATDAATARTNLDVYSKSEVDTALSGKASSSHNHDSAYDAKGAAATAETNAKAYADEKVANLLNNSTEAVDSIMELATAMEENADAIEALESIAAGKANASHTHAIADVSGLQSALDGKAAASHGTHVSFDSTNKPKMDGTAAFGTSTKVARADHIHPTDTSRASQADLDALEAVVDGKADSSHTHNYAGSSSAGGAATSANKVNSSLTVKLNSGTTEGTNMFTFNGSAAKSINITPSAIGAAASSHTHDDRYYTESEIDTKLAGKANSSHGNHVPATQTASDKVFLRNDNTWATITPANIGAAASSHTHAISDITNLQTTLNNASSAISANTSSISAHTDRITALETKVGDGFEEITSEEIQNLFSA